MNTIVFNCFNSLEITLIHRNVSIFLNLIHNIHGSYQIAIKEYEL